MKCINNQKGFTLLEVLIAIVLLTVGILAAGLMQVSALGGNSLADRTTHASTLASGAVEEIMNMGYNDPLLEATVNSDLVNPNEASILSSDLEDLDINFPAQQPEGYEVFWQVRDDYPFVDCKTIRVMVRRSDRGVMRIVAFDMIRKRPI